MLAVPGSFAQVHAFRTFPDGSLQDLGGGLASEGWHVNASGDVTGFEVHSEDGRSQSAFRFSDLTGNVDLGTLGGGRSSGLSAPETDESRSTARKTGVESRPCQPLCAASSSSLLLPSLVSS
jgi:hypothetical protein